MSECLYCKKPVFTANRFCSNRHKNEYYNQRRKPHRDIQIQAYGVDVNVPEEIRLAKREAKRDKTIVKVR
jgi:predicted nucleic acid-binding Zn ribbon protein